MDRINFMDNSFLFNKILDVKYIIGAMALLLVSACGDIQTTSKANCDFIIMNVKATDLTDNVYVISCAETTTIITFPSEVEQKITVFDKTGNVIFN